MNYNIKISSLIEIYNKFIKNDIKALIINHKKIIDVLIQLQTYFVEAKLDVPKWKVAIDALTTKAILHANSINFLMQGTYFKSPSSNVEVKIIDIPSLYVLIRAQLENLLIIDYLYLNAKNESESEFRYNCWMYSGLLARINKIAVSNTIKEQQDKDKIELARLKNLIDGNQLFHELFTSDKRKQFFKYGSPRLKKKWTDLAKESNLNDLIFINLYPALSNHAHSEALGVLNLQAKKIGYHEYHEEGYMLLFLSQITLSLVIKSFSRIFKVVEFKYNMMNSDIKDIIEFSAKMGKTKL